MILINNSRKHSILINAEQHADIVVPGECGSVSQVSRTIPDIELMPILPVESFNPQIAFRINADKRDKLMIGTWFITTCVGLVVSCP